MSAILNGLAWFGIIFLVVLAMIASFMVQKLLVTDYERLEKAN